MAKTLTLEEAAQQLGLSVEQFKLNLKTHKDFKTVRPLMGGTTMHFREQDVEELSRKLGMGSEPELKLGDAGSDPVVPLAVEDDDQVEIGREPARSSGSSSARLKSPSSKNLPKPKEEPLVLDTSDEFVPFAADSSAKNKKSDSGAKVRSGDSAARIEKANRPPAGTPTEEIDLDAEARRQGKSEVFELADEGSKSGRKSGPKAKPKTDKIKGAGKKADPGSEFELQLGADSDSEFELTLADDSDEVDLGSLPRDATGKTGKSGVKLNRPDDSGISLEKADDDSESDFELNLDSASAHKISGPKSDKKGKQPDSDSEFELSLDDSSGEVASLNLEEGGEQKDIFATDFDIPALDDSGSEAVVLEDNDTDLESSDFDLEPGAAEADDSASEVVQLDDDLVDDAAEVDELEEAPKSGKKKARGGKRRRLADDEDEGSLDDISEDEEEEEMAPALVGAAPPPARWGPLPALVLFPCMFVMLIITFMGFELLHGMWSYRSGGTKPTYTITRGIAGMFKDKNELPAE